MLIDVHILDTETGTRRVHETEQPDEYLSALPFAWGEGNFSCDCNRYDAFCEAGDEEPDEGHPCGHTRFTVERIVPRGGGAVLYADGLTNSDGQG